MHLEGTDTEPARGVVRAPSGVGQFRWNIDTGSWWWSDAMYRLYGYEPMTVEPTLESFRRHKDPRDMARIDAVFDRCLSDGGPFSCYHRIIDARGKRRTVVVVGYGDRDSENTRTVLMHGFMVDVTESGNKDTNAALQEVMQNRAGIEQIKGAVMLVYGINADGAFAVLRSHSQIYNKKVSAIVAALLEAFARRDSSESISRAELDQMLWDAAH